MFLPPVIVIILYYSLTLSSIILIPPTLLLLQNLGHREFLFLHTNNKHDIAPNGPLFCN